MDKCEMTLFLQSGAYKNNTLATIRIEVTSVECLYSQTQPGVSNTMSLALAANKTKEVSIFSSNPSNAYLPFDRQHRNKFNMIPNQFNFLEIQTKTYTPDKKEVLINAVGKYLFLFS